MERVYRAVKWQRVIHGPYQRRLQRGLNDKLLAYGGKMQRGLHNGITGEREHKEHFPRQHLRGNRERLMVALVQEKGSMSLLQGLRVLECFHTMGLGTDPCTLDTKVWYVCIMLTVQRHLQSTAWHIRAQFVSDIKGNLNMEVKLV